MNKRDQPANYTGGCLCGAVKYRVHGPLRPVIACHCEQCRRTSGHYVAATAARNEDFALIEDRGLEWYRSSARARRGFCRTCGSSLFWKPADKDRIHIMAGTLDQPTGLKSEMHIFVDQIADYHTLPAGVISLTSEEYFLRAAGNNRP